MFAISEDAVMHCRKALSIPDTTKASIRLSLVKGCCYSFYGVDITKEGRAGDGLIEEGGLRIYLDPQLFEGIEGPIDLDFTNNFLVVSAKGRLVATGQLISLKDTDVWWEFGMFVPELIIFGSMFKKKLVIAFAVNVFVVAIAAGFLVEWLVY